MKPPFFWHGPHFLGSLLSPLGSLYDLGVGLHQALRTPKNLPILAICVGNLVLGGAGKTPVSKALAGFLKLLGHRPHFILRGYGRGKKGTFAVEPHHTLYDVGDEALLLAQTAPTWVAACRLTAAQAAADAGASIVIFDDGFQDTSFKRQMNILVVDGHYGLGNGHIFPAGPLRESDQRALARATHLILLTPPSKQIPLQVAHQIEEHLQHHKLLPQWRGERIIQLPSSLENATGNKEAIAFAGIGNPHQFFDTLRQKGITLRETEIYPDHHPYSDKDLHRLINRGVTTGLPLITTEKDLIRIPDALKGHFQAPSLTIQFFQEAEMTKNLQEIFGLKQIATSADEENG